MTVRADNLAFLHLGQDQLPPFRSQVLADAERFVSQMVELEDHRVIFSTVDARVCLEVIDQVRSSFARKPALDCGGLIDVTLFVCLIVLSAIRGSAWTAERIALVFPPPPPGKFG